MGAWKLRAIVYGLLGSVAALVLWQSGALAGKPDSAERLTGSTDQRKANVTYRQHGDEFSVHERPDHDFGATGRARVNLHMRGAITDGGDRIRGVLWYTALPKGIACASPPVHFSVEA
jgi:hypothetical protein